MCGIAGMAFASGRPVEPLQLARMAAAIRHRGPDGYGFLADARVGLAHVRLSIVDLAGGAQPLANEDERLWITFNGEIFNWRELRDELETAGHRFRTHSDTEVIVHAWEQWGRGMLDRFNGQFAFAIYDRRDGSLFLARDRFGVRPLYLHRRGGELYFASEAKALFATGEVEAQADIAGLDEVFTFWSARAPRTVFRDVEQLPPGSWMHWTDKAVTTGRWWTPTYDEAADEPADALAHLGGILRSATGLRMRADVPVGGYLSGGLDSSITCSLAVEHTDHALRTFSVTFADPAYDESSHQRAVADAIHSDHAVTHISEDEIAAVFPEVVRHAETPMLRTAPAPMYLLAKLARERGITVVLTGEGSDEVFFGYDLFKESEVRRFCLRQPQSTARPQLFDRLYPYLRDGGNGGTLWRQFFLDAGSPDDALFSHQPRMRLARFVQDFYAADLRGVARPDPAETLRAELPAEFSSWSTVAQAAWIEIRTLLDGYLLSSQGDRMAMAHGVEGRYPFLDHRVFEFASRLPAGSKLLGLKEKDILKRWATGVVPDVVRQRSKQPYRAGDVAAFFGPTGARRDYVSALLDESAVRDAGLFEPAAVRGLLRRCTGGRATTARESQALVAVMSGQLWHQQFIAAPPAVSPLPLEGGDVLVGDNPLLPQHLLTQ
jgi:asparagine synthase (glutamine-hydrolysing)